MNKKSIVETELLHISVTEKIRAAKKGKVNRIDIEVQDADFLNKLLYFYIEASKQDSNS